MRLKSALFKIGLPVAIIGGAVVVTTLMVSSRPDAKREAPEPARIYVETLTADPQTLAIRIPSQGTVQPRTQTSLASEVSGRILEVAPSFAAGGIFHKGETLLRIDPLNYETALQQARAQVARMETQLQTEKALSAQAWADWQRLDKLREKPESDPASSLTLRIPQLAQARADLNAATAALQRAEADLERTRIKAPYSGIVRAKRADVGQFVTPGMPLLDIFAIDHAEVRLPISPGDLAYLDLPDGQGPDSPKPNVNLIDHSRAPSLVYDARITRTEGIFDPGNRALYAVAQVTDPYGILSPRPVPLRIGSYVEAHVDGIDLENVVVLPRHAVYHNDEVWIVDAEQNLHRRKVKVMRFDQDSAYISEGLDPGDKVCITPLTDPLPGTPVRLSEEA